MWLYRPLKKKHKQKCEAFKGINGYFDFPESDRNKYFVSTFFALAIITEDFEEYLP